jgi:hypothetical protein
VRAASGLYALLMAKRTIFETGEEHEAREEHETANAAAHKVLDEVFRKEYAARHAKFAPELEARLGSGYRETVDPKHWMPVINKASAEATGLANDAYQIEYQRVLARLRYKN